MPERDQAQREHDHDEALVQREAQEFGDHGSTCARSSMAPSTTTRSPAFSPRQHRQHGRRCGSPVFTSTGWKRPAARSIHTIVLPPLLHHRARREPPAACASSPCGGWCRTSPGAAGRAALSISARTLMVRVCGSTVSAMRVTRPRNVSPGNAVSSTSMRSPGSMKRICAFRHVGRDPDGAQIRDGHHRRVGVVAILAGRDATSPAPCRTSARRR